MGGRTVKNKGDRQSLIGGKTVNNRGDGQSIIGGQTVNNEGSKVVKGSRDFASTTARKVVQIASVLHH